ncbi:uncharacterized protein M6B38_391565 [Iris pallida]|uniref:C2 domain-containing protein n=1 Tax=Iris pallida TaxID=29817 RepID=A0AAX6FYY0_IRIPA|nr:uncharacterized protein M6B38_391565 [Iris pallida]
MAATLSSSHILLHHLSFHPHSPPPLLVSNKPHSATFSSTKHRFRVSKSTTSRANLRNPKFLCSSSSNGGLSTDVEAQRPPFDLNLAVVLAGFAFEAYTSPPENAGWRETDAAQCQTVFLSKEFLREVYDGQLLIKLRKGMNFPALDPWGTSDPYVVLQLDGQVAKSKIKWATTDPEWNENFTFNIRIPPTNLLQVAAWDANLVTPHKRMGNSGLNVEALCDGNLHESVVELEGLGGGGKIYLEVRYKSFDEIDQEKQWWKIPFVSDFLMKSSLGSALKMALGSESINASQFVQSAFGQLKPSFSTYIQEVPTPNSEKELSNGSEESLSAVAGPEPLLKEQKGAETSVDNMKAEDEKNSLEFDVDDDKKSVSLLDKTTDVSLPQDKYFWETFSQLINQTVVQKFGFTLPEIRLWEGFDLLNKMNLQSQKIAEEEYVESGLATPVPTPENSNDNDSQKDLSRDGTLSSILDIRKASWNVLSQTETILGALMVLTTLLPQKKDLTSVADENKRDPSMTEREDATGHSLEKTENSLLPLEASNLDTRKAEEMRKLFSSAESAMEAWAMLATSLGRTSFIKSEFEKICFLDNDSTDTQASSPLARLTSKKISCCFQRY